MTSEEQTNLEGKTLGKIKKETEEKRYVILSGKSFRIKIGEDKVDSVKDMTNKRKKYSKIVKMMRCYTEDEPLDGVFEADKKAPIAWFGG